MSYDLVINALRVIYNSAWADAKIESKIKETIEMNTDRVSWTTMRIDHKECSTTRRSNVESGSPFKNWLIKGSLHDVNVTMRTSHAIYNSLHADVWYDFKIQDAKSATRLAPYWITTVCENGRNAKISLLEDVGIPAELAHLILEYSFPTVARIAIRTKGRAAPRMARGPVELAWQPCVDRWKSDMKSNTIKPQKATYQSKRIAAMQKRDH